MGRGGTAAVTEERRDHTALLESISDANTITLKQLMAIIWTADPYVRKSTIVDATLMSTGMTTWGVSQPITMETMKADIRITVASPLGEVEEAAIRVNPGLTTALPVIELMGYEHLLNIWKGFISRGENREQICV